MSSIFEKTNIYIPAMPFFHLSAFSFAFRGDMSKPAGFYETDELRRTVDGNWRRQPGCVHDPLFTIPVEKIILDELHMFLRVMDRLEYGVVMNAIEKDQVMSI